jgi:Amt family ammonium transporter
MRRIVPFLSLIALLVAPGTALADDGVTPGQFTANNVWMMLAAGLVFIMHLGFATLESGLTRAKNTTNILFKNTFIISIGILTYALCGFNGRRRQHHRVRERRLHVLDRLPLPGDVRGYRRHHRLGGRGGAHQAALLHDLRDGLRGDRLHHRGLLEVGRRLARRGFYDFAGSTLVHSVGGWGALAGALLLGPRLGKYVGGKLHPIPGSNMPMAAVGVFLLWLGWFGFNGGSVLSADPALTSFTLVTTCLAAAAGALAAMVASWIVSTKPDLSMSLNGVLAGLVGITAGADTVTILGAVIIGLVAGVLVVGSVMMFDRIKIDDPVGAISVHLTCGIWGTLAVGIFSTNPEHSFATQLLGVGAYGAFAFGSALAIFGVLKATVGLRVSEEEEVEGLDVGEHGQHAYDLGLGSAGSFEHVAPALQGRPVGHSALATSERS